MTIQSSRHTCNIFDSPFWRGWRNRLKRRRKGPTINGSTAAAPLAAKSASADRHHTPGQCHQYRQATTPSDGARHSVASTPQWELCNRDWARQWCTVGNHRARDHPPWIGHYGAPMDIAAILVNSVAFLESLWKYENFSSGRLHSSLLPRVPQLWWDQRKGLQVYPKSSRPWVTWA